MDASQLLLIVVLVLGLGFEFVNGPCDSRLDIAGQPPQLPLCCIGKLNVPVHA